MLSDEIIGSEYMGRRGGVGDITHLIPWDQCFINVCVCVFLCVCVCVCVKFQRG